MQFVFNENKNIYSRKRLIRQRERGSCMSCYVPDRKQKKEKKERKQQTRSKREPHISLIHYSQLHHTGAKFLYICGSSFSNRHVTF